MAHGRSNTPVDGPKVCAMREHAGLNLRDLAALSGVSASTISRIERDVCVPRPGALLKIATALGVTPQDLCKQEVSA